MTRAERTLNGGPTKGFQGCSDLNLLMLCVVWRPPFHNTWARNGRAKASECKTFEDLSVGASASLYPQPHPSIGAFTLISSWKDPPIEDCLPERNAARNPLLHPRKGEGEGI